MELNKGLVKQTTTDKVPNGSWIHARNICVGSSIRNITNEKGFAIQDTFGGGSGVIIGYIDMNSDCILFIQSGSTGEIVLYSKMNVATTILRSTGLNFNINNPIRGDFTYNFKGERIITWWDGLDETANSPKLLNIDCLPFEVDIFREPINIEDLELLLLFSNIGHADITLNSVNNGGGELKTGAYWVCRAYQHPDGSLTNFSPPSNPIFIVDESITNKYSEIDGAEGGTETFKSFTITFNNLSTQFNRLVVAIIARNNGVLTARTLSVIKYDTNVRQVTVTGVENSTSTSLGAILTPNATYNRVHTGVFLENRLHLSNTKKETIVDFQPHANYIKLKWVREQDINIGKYEGSYKDAVMLFDKKSFPTDEVFAFYIALGMKDGTISEWYHIPGAEETTIGIGAYTDTDLISDIYATNPSNDFAEALLIDSNAKYYQFFNNAKSTGEMSFWENEDEVYPDTDCFDINDGAHGIVGTLRNKKIRHHKFPSLKLLNDWGREFYTPTSGNANEVVLKVEAGTPGVNYGGSGYQNWGGNLDYDFVNNPIASADFNITSTVDGFEAVVLNPLNVLINYSFRLWANSTGSLQIEIFSLTGRVYTNSSNVIGTIFSSERADIDNGNKPLEFTLAVGWIIKVKATRENTTDTPTLSGSLNIVKNNYENVITTTKAIGVRFSDIFIPQAIKSKVNCLYFGYASRTTLNSTKISFSPLDYNNDLSVDPRRKFVVRDFDMLTGKPIVNVNYFKQQLLYNFPTAEDTSQLLITKTPSYASTLHAVKNVEYKPKLYFQDEGETLLEDEFHIETENDYLPVFVLNNVVFISLFSYKKNVYYKYNEQQINIMGYSPIQTNVTLYNGDITINYLSLTHLLYRTVAGGYTSTYRFILSYLREGITNSELRHSDGDKTYFPKGQINNIGIASVDNVSTINYFIYNKDYSVVNNLVPQTIFECEEGCTQFIDSFPVRISRSLISGTEDGQSSWRTFKINEYYDMTNRDKGAIHRIDKYGDSLIIHQQYSLFIANVKDILYTNDTDIFISKGDIFDRPPREVVIAGKSNSYAGCQSLWGGKVCKQGYVFVDKNAGKIFVFKGELQEISAQGMLHFFEENIKGYKDVIGDNPFLDNGIIVGYDGEENRILVTILLLPFMGIDSYTISYSFHRDMWIAEHDYVPNAYIDNLEGVYCLRNANSFVPGSSIYKMNMLLYTGKYFTTSKIYPSYIDVVFSVKEAQKGSVRFMAVYWETEFLRIKTFLISNADIIFDKTISQIMAYDNHKNTGLINIDNSKRFANNNSRRVGEGWTFNDLRDVTINKNLKTIDNFGNIVSSNLTNSKVFFKKSNFIGTFIVVRFQYDNDDNHVMILKDVNVLINNSER